MLFKNPLLLFHIICGAIALLSGLTALIVKKGKRIHKLSGRVFYWMMILVAFTSFILAMLKFNPFLLAIGIFTLYMIVREKRYIYYHNLISNYTPALIDKLPIYTGLITSIFMIVFPVYTISKDGVNTTIVLMVFGAILLMNVISDLKLIRKNVYYTPGDGKWILKHIGMMTGAYIATVTAFLVNTVHLEPGWILWLGPSVIGTIYIILSINKWRKKTATIDENSM